MTPPGAEKSKSFGRSKTVIATVLLNFCLLFLVSSLQVKAFLLLWRWYFGEVREIRPSVPTLGFQNLQSRLPAHVVPSQLYPGFSDVNYFLHKFQQEPEETMCWRNAYTGILPQCEIGIYKERRSRLALVLANCFLASSGLPQAHCPESKPVMECTATLSGYVHSILVGFYNEAESICHYLQGLSIDQRPKAGLDSKGTARNQEGQMEESEQVLAPASQFLDYTSSTEQTSHGDPVAMQNKLDSTMEGLSLIASEAYQDLERAISSQDEMLEEQRSLAEALSLEVARLRADNINIAASVVDFLQEMPKLRKPEGAEDALPEALAAMGESMSSLQQLSEVARIHKDELTSWQTELDAMHQRLADGSSEMVKAQDVIATKQSVAVESLDNLFIAHDMVLNGTKPLKTFLSYLLFASILYFVTNSKQTQGARMLMYCVLLPGLCLETLVILLQMTDPLINFQKFNVQLSWIRWIVTGLEFFSLDYKTSALRGLAFYCFKTMLPFPKKVLKGANKTSQGISKDDPLYRPPRHEGRPQHRYMLRQNSRRPGSMQSRSTNILNSETVEEFTDLIMNGRPFDEG